MLFLQIELARRVALDDVVARLKLAADELYKKAPSIQSDPHYDEPKQQATHSLTANATLKRTCVSAMYPPATKSSSGSPTVAKRWSLACFFFFVRAIAPAFALVDAAAVVPPVVLPVAVITEVIVVAELLIGGGAAFAKLRACRRRIARTVIIVVVLLGNLCVCVASLFTFIRISANQNRPI